MSDREDRLGALEMLGPERYDRLFRARTLTDLPFWLNRCSEARRRGSGRVLEIACGTGRLTVPLARVGHDVSGIDLLPDWLEVARRRAEDVGVAVPLHHADMRDFQLDGTFSLVFLPFNTFLVLTSNDDVMRFLERVRAHLEPDGRFVVEAFLPRADLLARDPETEVPVGEFPDPDDPSGETMLTVTELPWWDPALQQCRPTWICRRDGEEIGRGSMRLRCFFPLELEALLGWAGFRVTRKWGDHEEGEFHAGSPAQLVEAAVTR